MGILSDYKKSWLYKYSGAGLLEQGLDSLTKGLQNDLKDHPGSGASAIRDVADFYQSEVVEKDDLRTAQVESVLGGVPIVGSVLRGLEGVQQLEDYYNNAGKVPEYPLGNSLSGAGLGAGVSSGVSALTGNGPGYKAGKMSLEDFYYSYY